ncbi:lipopolysaccharide biosynthesis protein [Sphingomonas sp. 8AM]|uniref:lipopolysaccharide biosynthesis protein n=1 Tax=Sphingomonas sp. 8AM TaxID=2653170 RepID=UPI0012F0A8DA|nr:lipopolysaccharide biosynthesis protein [Sphingomonas sp. 8AM]VXD00979.1 membrane hypothetical protein [Sphingomonas sp. 8AM]
MKLARSLKTNALVYLIGTGLYALTQWALVVVFARSQGPAAVGLFAVATAVSAPIIVLSQMSMRQVLIADVKGRFSFVDYLRARWLLSVVAFLTIVAVALAIGYRGKGLLIIAGFALGRVFESVSDIYYAQSQAEGGLHRVSFYTAARGIVTLSIAAGAAIVTHDLLTAACGFAVASLLCQLGVREIEGRIIPESRRKPTLRLSGALLRHAAPLAVSQFLIAATAYAPRLILQHFGGEQLAGQASAVEYFLAMGTLGVAALGQAASAPIAAAYHRASDRTFVRLVTMIAGGAVLLAAIMALAANLFGHAVILALYGSSFEAAAQAAPAIVTGGVVGYIASVLGYAVSATGRYDHMVRWAFAVLLTTIIGGCVMVDRFGLIGLGYALAVGGALNIAAYVHLLHRAWATSSSAAAAIDAGAREGVFDG